MSTVIRDLIGLRTAAVLLTGAIALDHLVRRLLAGAAMPGPGEAPSMLSLPSADPTAPETPSSRLGAAGAPTRLQRDGRYSIPP